MSVGLTFLRGVVEAKAKPTFLSDYGLTSDYFTKDEKKVLRFVNRHIKRYGRLPKFTSLLNKFEDFDFDDVDGETPKYLADRVVSRYVALKIRESIKDANEKLQETEPEEAINVIHGLSSELAGHSQGTQIDTLVSAGAEILKDHDSRQQGLMEETNVPFGFPSLDKISGGAQKGETIALVGESGIGKTYVTCKVANAGYDAENTPLIVSMEMSSIQIARRVLALRSKVNETKIRRGELSTFEGRKRLVTNLEELKEIDRPFYIVDGRLVLRVEQLDAVIATLNPTSVYLDGAYLLKTQYSAKDRWGGVADASEQIKLIAASRGIPIFGTYQFNEKGEIYGGRSIKQLAGVVIHLLYDDDEDDEDGSDVWSINQTRILDVVKGRFGEFGKIRISYNMLTSNISEIEQLPWTRPRRKKRKRK